MPADYRVIEAKGLVYVKFWGHLAMQHVADCLERFSKEPASLTYARHLVDFSEITAYDDDVVKILEMQARLAEVFTGDMDQWIFAYFAPTHVSRELANFGIRAWSGVDQVVIRMTANESDSFDILGLPDRTIREALADVAPFGEVS